MLFGEFLYLKSAVDEATLLRALGEQVRARPLLGEIAVQEGYMTAWDVYRVMNLQVEQHRYFGDIALELGILSDDELDHVLAVQGDSTPPLGEILVQRGVFTSERLQELLQEFAELKARGDAAEASESASRRSA